ncbi:group II intron maturase-specific domain-containing protein [Streptomyces sp. NPDC020755]|uniref:group II intron maturase-specific domain-containing protein n=1 Tax=unclassified Streptomyces TaxID=2593676 RepID=UPI0022424742|nr:group II intron maturase-specific domain-containing protein [Streptomyces sp. VB1]UZI33404.1 hypothetical protein OH133_37920 [Streptomyces sp. VB1]
MSFDPGISKDALKKISGEVRSWHLHTRSDLSFTDLARRINPVVAGPINYYGRFRPSELTRFWKRINAYLVRWIRQKYERLAPLRARRASPAEGCGPGGGPPPRGQLGGVPVQALHLVHRQGPPPLGAARRPGRFP